MGKTSPENDARKPFRILAGIVCVLFSFVLLIAVLFERPMPLKFILSGSFMLGILIYVVKAGKGPWFIK